MPIDPTIPLEAFKPQPQKIFTPSEIEDNMTTAAARKEAVETQRLKNEEARQEAQDRFQMQQMLKETGGDVDKVIMRMMSINPKLALELKEQKAKDAKATSEALKAGIDAYGAQLDRGSKMAGYIQDQTTLDEILPDIAAISPDVASYLGRQYDPQRVQNVRQMVLSEQERMANLDKGLTSLASGKPQQGLAYWLSTARNQQEWDGYMRGQDAVGIPREFQTQMKALFGDYTPENVQRAKDYVAQNPQNKPANAPNSQSKSMLYIGNDPNLKALKGKIIPVDYYPGEGTTPARYQTGQTVIPTGDLREPPSATAQAAATAIGDKTALELEAQQVWEGKALMSMYPKRGAHWNALMNEVNKIAMRETGKPYNAVQAEINYNAMKKFVASLNSNQMLNFRRLTDKVQHTIEEMRSLGDQLQQGSIQKWNEAKRDTLTQLFGNTPYSALANQYMIATNFLKEEFAQMANGGYAPTAPAWHLADEQINKNFGVKDMHASLAELQRMIGFSTDAISNIGPGLMPGTDRAIGGYDPNAQKLQGKIPAEQIPLDIAQALTSPAAAQRIKEKKSVTFNVTDKATGKKTKWVIYPDGSATEMEVPK